MSDLVLTPGERDSALWKRLEAHLTELRDAYRVKIEGPLEQPETDRTRGRIAILNELIDLGKAESSKTP